MQEFNGYDFDNKVNRKKMKYISIFKGDLDSNGAYAFTNKRELNQFLKEKWKDVYAVFKIKDITKPF